MLPQNLKHSIVLELPIIYKIQGTYMKLFYDTQLSTSLDLTIFMYAYFLRKIHCRFLWSSQSIYIIVKKDKYCALPVITNLPMATLKLM